MRPVRKWVWVIILALLVTLGLSACGRAADRKTAPRPRASSERTVAPAPTPPEPTPTPEPTQPPPAPEPTPTPPPPPAPKPPTPAPTNPAPTDNTKRGWYYVANSSHLVPGVAPGAKDLLAKYGGRYTGPSRSRVYLTFDEGYENGNTATILDALARNGVRATFFVTETYIRANPALVRRMVAEGHVVGNHSATHPSMPTLAKDPKAFAAELTKTAKTFKDTTGQEIAQIFRPPMGEYSPLSLWRTQSLGYESIFWSFAHKDWLVDDQPPVATTVKRILDGSHPGAIYLLHGVSSSDTQALDDAIAGLREQGYGFGVLQ